MKIILRSLLIASLLFSPFSQAGAKPGEGWMGKEKMEQRREEFHRNRLETLSRELGLSKEQEEKISRIMKKGWEKIVEEMRKMRERVLAIRKETDSQIEKLLSAEQAEKFKQLKEKLKEKSSKEPWMRRGEGRHPGPEPESPEPEHGE